MLNQLPNDAQTIEAQLVTIQRSTKTTLPGLLPMHEWLRNKSRLYYNWHISPYANGIHLASALSALAVAVIKIAVIIVPFINPTPSLAAESWRSDSSIEEFSAGTPDENIIFTNTSDGEITTSGIINPGTFISRTINTYEFSNFSTLRWNVDAPEGTTVQFQLRSATYEAELAAATWYGPTSIDDYYTVFDTAINSVHDGDQWVQYKLILTPDGVNNAPTVNMVALGYETGDKTISTNTYFTENAYTMNNLDVTNGATLTLAGNTRLHILGNLNVDDSSGATAIICEGKNSDLGGGTGCIFNVEGTVIIDATSSINADGQGYIAGIGPGSGSASGNTGSGGGHGGQGGTSGAGDIGGGEHDNKYAPSDFGYGGGLNEFGGPGGGAINITAGGEILINGVISANGTDGSGGVCGEGSGGGGAGGSIYLTANVFNGIGTITAGGGAGVDGGCEGAIDDSGGGGGGRIALIYQSSGSTLPGANLTAAGGGGSTGGMPGSGGTVVYGPIPEITVNVMDRNLYNSHPELWLEVDDVDNRSLHVRFQYISDHHDRNCDDASFNDAITIDSSIDPTGWSGSGLYDTSGGLAGVTYTFQNGLGTNDYCWRASTRASSGSQDGWSDWTEARCFVVDALPPVEASVSNPTEKTYYVVQKIPTSFSGIVADDNQIDFTLPQNSTTFTLQRTSDSKYWTGTTWQADVAHLATQHPEPPQGRSAEWSSNVALPEWNDDSYTVQVTASDWPGNSFTGNAITFSVDTTDVTPPDPIVVVFDSNEYGTEEQISEDQDYSNVNFADRITGRWPPSEDRESGLEQYEAAVGTTPGGTDVVNWTRGTMTIPHEEIPIPMADFTGLTLQEGVTYYFSVRAVDRAENVSAVTTSDGITIDLTPPDKVATVVWGNRFTSPQVLSNSSTALTTSWPETNDSVSGINRYEYALGTSPESSDVLNWTRSDAAPTNANDYNVSSITTYSQQITGLSLQNDVTYYTSIRAIDNANNISEIQTSNGILIDTIAPDAPVITEPAPDGVVVNDNTPIISGTAEPNTNIDLTVSGQTLNTTTSNEGKWSVELASALELGKAYTIAATATDAAGNISSTSNRLFNVAAAKSTKEPTPTEPTQVTNPGTEEPTSTEPTQVTNPGTEEPTSTEPTQVTDPSIYVKTRGVTFAAKENQTIQLYRGDTATVIVVPSEASALSSASVEIHDVTYELATQNNGSFVRNFSPEEIGSTASGSVRFRFTNNESGEQSLNLLANPFGYVYTLNDQDREVRVHDAVVSIEYRTSATDSWKTWNANTYSQTNPQITNQQGEYGFVVPTGKYRLKAEADGYHQSVSDELITNGEPINLAIELKPLGVVGSALDTIGVMKPIDTAVNAVDQPRTNATNVIIAALTILATLGLTIAPVLGGGFVPSLIMTGNAPTPLTNILLGIAQRMRRNSRYGRVYDAATNKPIQGATIRLFSEGACGLEKGKLIGSQTTNEHGFYHIYAAKGKYRMEAIAPNYTFPSKIAPLGYKGEVRTLIGSGPLHPDIPLDGRTPAYANVLLGLRRLAGRLRRARLLLLIGGSIFSIIAFMLSKTQLNGIVLGIYVLIWLNEAWIYLSNKRRARVRSGSTPICLALVRIYDEDGVLLATRATDERGEFNVLLPIGVYTVTIVKNGYEQLTKTIRQHAHGTLKTTFKLKKISA